MFLGQIYLGFVSPFYINLFCCKEGLGDKRGFSVDFLVQDKIPITNIKDIKEVTIGSKVLSNISFKKKF